jgi:hypothetical protein
MKSNSWIILELLIGLLGLSVLSFFVSPSYEKGVWAIMGALIMAFGNAMGTKSGSSMPQQVTDAKPGQSSQVQSTIETVPEPPAEPAAPASEPPSVNQ